MKRSFLALVMAPALLLSSNAGGQNPVVQAAIDAVSIDSLIHDLRLLTGEDPVDVGNGDQLITSRNKNNPGNHVAALWLQQRLVALGYVPSVQIFSGGTGENIIAVKPGAVYPDRKVVVCGHYDALPGGPVDAPAADDDGSGTVAVLEAARVLAPYQFENTIVFALWDEEEQGLLGSEYYAGAAAANDDTLAGVVNMDAISYDGDGDGLLRVHVRPIANSIAIKDSALMVNTTYGLALPIAVNNPGATYSDHAAFWNEDYGAILIIEDFDDDANPHYHTPTDLIDYIDQPYFHGLARLGIGTTAVLAKPLAGQTAIAPVDGREQRGLFAYPNPTLGTTFIRVVIGDGQTNLALFDAMGKEVLVLADDRLAQGKHAYEFDASVLVPGSYVLRLTVDGRASTFPLVRIP